MRISMRVPPSSALTALGLAGGFAVGRATHKRALGGALWAAAGALCLPRWRRAGWARASLLGVTYVGALGGSHPLAKRIGAWPSIAVVTAAMSASAALLADRRPR
ncbi:MAG: hypothetical protein ACRDZX_00170 [Acidimicrobiales bacterium]